MLLERFKATISRNTKMHFCKKTSKSDRNVKKMLE